VVCLLNVKAMITVREFFVLLICTFWRSKRVTMFGAWKISQFCFAYFVFHIFCLVDNSKSCIQISPGAWYFGLFNGVGPTRT
jgi:hypothetical protein